MEMRVTSEIPNEQVLIQSLRDVLNRLDKQLLRDLQTVVAEHELRRAIILRELQVLGDNIGILSSLALAARAN